MLRGRGLALRSSRALCAVAAPAPAPAAAAVAAPKVSAPAVADKIAERFRTSNRGDRWRRPPRKWLNQLILATEERAEADRLVEAFSAYVDAQVPIRRWQQVGLIAALCRTRSWDALLDVLQRRRRLQLFLEQPKPLAAAVRALADDGAWEQLAALSRLLPSVLEPFAPAPGGVQRLALRRLAAGAPDPSLALSALQQAVEDRAPLKPDVFLAVGRALLAAGRAADAAEALRLAEEAGSTAVAAGGGRMVCSPKPGRALELLQADVAAALQTVDAEAAPEEGEAAEEAVEAEAGESATEDKAKA